MTILIEPPACCMCAWTHGWVRFDSTGRIDQINIIYIFKPKSVNATHKSRNQRRRFFPRLQGDPRRSIDRSKMPPPSSADAAGAGKGHRKSKVGRKAEKRKVASHKKKGTLDASKASKAVNPRAFGFQSAGKAKAQRARSAEKEQRRMHGAGTAHAMLCVLMALTSLAAHSSSQLRCLRSLWRSRPRWSSSCRCASSVWNRGRIHDGEINRAITLPYPFPLPGVQGPPGVGKSTLIRCLTKHFTQQSLGEVLGPITVVAGDEDSSGATK